MGVSFYSAPNFNGMEIILRGKRYFESPTTTIKMVILKMKGKEIMMAFNVDEGEDDDGEDSGVDNRN